MKINKLTFNRQNLYLVILTSLFFFSYSGFSQGVSINETNTPPDPSAMLDVQSTTKGFLPPRVTSAERAAIMSPASGLLVFDTDFNALFVNTGEGWMRVESGEKWLKDEDNNLTYNLGKVGIGVNYPDAELEVNGQVRITGGDPGSGKVLTSDAEGTASWQNSPMSILSLAQANGNSSVSSSLAFLTNPANITLTETARILINSTAGLGTTAGINTAGALNVYICYRNNSGGTITTLGAGIFGLRLPAGTRIPFSLSSSTGFLPAGNYDVGICGISSDPTQWNSNEWSYTTAMAYQLPAAKSSASTQTDDSFESLFGRGQVNENLAPSPAGIAAEYSDENPSSQDKHAISVEERIEQLQIENENIKEQLNTLMKMIETNSSSASNKK